MTSTSTRRASVGDTLVLWPSKSQTNILRISDSTDTTWHITLSNVIKNTLIIWHKVPRLKKKTNLKELLLNFFGLPHLATLISFSNEKSLHSIQNISLTGIEPNTSL